MLKQGDRMAGDNTTQKTREKILALIKDSPVITTDELAEKIGISTKGIEWQLKKLQEEGILKRIGPDKGGHWEIVGVKS